MAVLGRLLISSAERIDLSDLSSIDSYIAGDFKYLLKGLVGSDRPYIIKGFDVIDPNNAIGTQSCSIRVADSMVLYPGSSSGPFFHGLSEGTPEAAPLVPELRKNAVNYVYLTLTTYNTSVDTRAFWDPDKDGGVGGEFTQDVNTESVLMAQVNVSTSSFPANTIPVAKITVGPVVITAIEDARDLMYRLGTGGINPDPYNTYDFRSLPAIGYERAETPNTMTSSGSPNAFQGGDKNFYSLKEWMDVVMTKLLELGGTNYWYENASTYSLISLFSDALGTTLQSKGAWEHDSATEGLLSWSEDLVIKHIVDNRNTIIRAGSKSLSNEQVMYIELLKNEPINTTNSAVSWISGVNYVNGITGTFENLKKGDWVKKKTDSDSLYLRVEEFYANNALGGGATTASLARSIRLSAVYTGTTQSEKGVFTRGVYDVTDVQVASRAATALASAGGKLHWLAMRSDIVMSASNIVTSTINGTISDGDGEKAAFAYVGHGLVSGDRVTISGTTSYNGTFLVEVVDADTFYIQTSATTTEPATARWATVTTTSTSTLYGLQLESANHGFESDNKITIAGTTNYNGSYLINVTSPTSFTVPMSGAFATETTGTATLARIDVRSETGIERVVRGEIKEVSNSVTSKMMSYLGMLSETQDTPLYSTPSNYNALNGYHNYNSLASDNITVRVSKLTAMMADRVQDRDMQFIGRTTIKNVTNGGNQDITANNTLTLVKPGSASQSVSLACSIPTNSAAVIDIDRDGGAALTPTIVALDSQYLIQENRIILFYRFNTASVYTWDGTQIIANGSHTTHIPDDSQNKNISVFNPGNIAFDSGTGLVTFLDSTADVEFVIPGSSATNLIDVSAINTLGAFVFPADDYAAWVRIDRNVSKTFNLIDTLDSADTNANGKVYITAQSLVPIDQDVIVFMMRKAGAILETKAAVTAEDNVYDEQMTIVSGLPVDDNEMTGPVLVGQTVVLPLDSRAANVPQEYVTGAGHLELYLNGQLLVAGSDYFEVGTPPSLSNQITIQQQLEIGDVLTFRIDTRGSVYISGGGGGGSDSLQTAYNTGRFITVASGQPIVINGPVSQKLLTINGDIDVTGVIDPKGITFSLESSDPLAPTDHGLWINSSGELIHNRGGISSPINLTVATTGGGAASAIESLFTNNTGSAIPKLTPVRINSSGDLGAVDPSIEAHVQGVIGITRDAIPDTDEGVVTLSGRLLDITTTASFGDSLYLSKSGTVTNVKPSEGVDGFVAGDFIVRLGVVAKNRSNPSNKDMIINISIVGQI